LSSGTGSFKLKAPNLIITSYHVTEVQTNFGQDSIT